MPRDSKGRGKSKSGWSKPDGTPLRKRKGDFFPDKEIDARKPSKKRFSGSGSDSYSSDSDKPAYKPRTERSGSGRDSEKAPFRKKTSDKDASPRGERSYSRFKSAGRAADRKTDRPYERKTDRPSGRKGSDDQTKTGSGEAADATPRPVRSSYGREANRKSGRPYERNRPTEKRTDAEGTDSDSAKPASRGTYGRDSGSKYERKKPFEKKREKYADKDHSKEMRGRFDRDKPKPRRAASGPHRERKPRPSSSSVNESAPIRLNRYISNAGICSRREADDMITAGVISINGVVVTELGTKVMPGDEVKFHDQPLRTERHVYVLLNKPKDYITTADDPEERKTVMNLVHDACKERIYPVGRLDRNTTGLLLLTNDGELTKKLTHPSSNIKKLYQVELDKNLTQADMIRAAEGVELEDGISGFDEIQYASPTEKNIIGVELHSGKNRIVRRIFEELGYKVKKLDRTIFAGLTKKDLPRGRWRFLTEMEVSMLKMLRK